jgi:uncharacterized membrane protein
MRLPAVVRHVAYNLRGGFLIRPLIITLVLGGAGFAISTLEEMIPALDRAAPRWPFPSHADAQVAQLILSSIATAVMTVVSIVFAMLLMTLTLASMQFSPRILVGFARDRVTQWTLGVFLGTFSYCIAVMPAAHAYPEKSEPVIAVMGAMLLGWLCVVWLLFFIHHISTAISVNQIVDNIARETEQTIGELMPNRRPKSKSWGAPAARAAETAPEGAPVTSVVSGYIRYADFRRLCAIAKSQHITVYVTRRIGHFVPVGGVLMVVSKPDRLSPEIEAALLGAFDIGSTRTLQQDIEFGILQIVDIALRAISPAVNDPTTAITCVDQLSRILICVAGREPFASQLYDPPGVLRVVSPAVGLERMVDYAFEQIRVYAKGDLAVSMRLLRALGDVGGAVPDANVRKFLSGRASRVVAGAATKMTAEEMEELEDRNEALQRQLLDFQV